MPRTIYGFNDINTWIQISLKTRDNQDNNLNIHLTKNWLFMILKQYSNVWPVGLDAGYSYISAYKLKKKNQCLIIMWRG